MVVQFIVFLTPSTLICGSTDISKCFSESLAIWDNDYISVDFHQTWYVHWLWRSGLGLLRVNFWELFACHTIVAGYYLFRFLFKRVITFLLSVCVPIHQFLLKRGLLKKERIWVQSPPRLVTFFRGDWSWNIFYGHSLSSADSRRAVVSFWRKNVHNTG